jgi:hypothetical protein
MFFEMSLRLTSHRNPKNYSEHNSYHYVTNGLGLKCSFQILALFYDHSRDLLYKGSIVTKAKHTKHYTCFYTAFKKTDFAYHVESYQQFDTRVRGAR